MSSQTTKDLQSTPNEKKNSRLTNKFYKKNFYNMMWHNMIGFLKS
jgi:hypothetical protein